MGSEEYSIESAGLKGLEAGKFLKKKLNLNKMLSYTLKKSMRVSSV
jgi:hypothetical protein